MKKRGDKILMAKTRSNTGEKVKESPGTGEKVKESPGFLCILLSY